MDYVFFSENLKRYYPKVYNELTEILSKHDVHYSVLKGTADYWCRDYMPVQVDGNSFVQFNPNRSLETELALFLMTAIRKMWLYIVGS